MTRRSVFLTVALVAIAPVAYALPIDFTNFHTPAQVDTIMNDLQAAHPAICHVVTIGTSLEGRPIKALKISDNVMVDEPEGDVVFVALHHAREWIATEVALSLAEQILTQYGSNPQLTADVNNLQIWIVPVVNPDGYAYTVAMGGDRYWRKNRRDNGDGTFGVDLNRNWGYEWGLASGSSANTWDDTYHGTAAFSEPETTVIRNFLQGLGNLKTLLTYHSYSELFLRPWAYIGTDPPGEPTLAGLAIRSINAIQSVHGITYAQNIGYFSSGEATDYLWGETRTSAFTPELRPACCGLSGFSPAPSEIVPTNEENLPAALALIHDAGSRELWIRDYPGDTGDEPSAVWTGSGWSHAFWISPDITTAPATFTEGQTVTLSVHVSNNTGMTKNNVRLDTYFTDPRISLEFPNPAATLIDSRTVSVPAAGLTASFPWTVPMGTNSWGEYHWCVGAVIMHDTDMPLTTQAQRTSNIAIHNFTPMPVLTTGSNLIVAATNDLDTDAELIIKIDRDLPPGWKVVIPSPPKRPGGRPPLPIERKARLLRAGGYLLAPGESLYIPVRVTPPKNARRGDAADINVHGALMPLVIGKRAAVGNGYTYHVTVVE